MKSKVLLASVGIYLMVTSPLLGSDQQISGQLKNWIVSYPPVKSQNHGIMREEFMKEHYLESIAQGLDRAIRTPVHMFITMEECNMVNAFYNPSTHGITMCYELFDSFEKSFTPYVPPNNIAIAVMGSWWFIFYHELGHALVDVLQIPITGKEEDAVDQLSTLLLSSGEAQVQEAGLAGAYYFWLSSRRNQDPLGFWLRGVLGTEQHLFSDEHSLNEQRFYNVICWYYGKDQKQYQSLVSSGTLPPQRAQLCPSEYSRIKASWEKLLEPHIKR